MITKRASPLPTGTFPVHATATLASLNSSTHLPQRLNASTASRSNDSTLQRLPIISSFNASTFPPRPGLAHNAPANYLIGNARAHTLHELLHYSLPASHHFTTHYSPLTTYFSLYSLLTTHSCYPPATIQLSTHSPICYSPITTHSSPTHRSATHQPLLTLHPLTALLLTNHYSLSTHSLLTTH